jgi:hypothetical protein
MQGAKRSHATFYRCCARTLVPGARAAADHPPNANAAMARLRGALEAGQDLV